ncbi:MAG: dephospho-CoA kinase [Planctomycetota bacterium]
MGAADRPTAAEAGAAARGPAPLVVGVLGGIASGKSTVGQALADDPRWVLSADRIAQELLDSPAVTAQVARAFGAEVLGPDGRPDRAALAARVFDDPEARARLEGWIHPGVRATIRARLEEAEAARAALVVLDVPLLLEHAEQHGLLAACDALVFVDTPDEIRDARAQQTRAWPTGEVARRERAQLPLSEKRRRADHVLPNDGTRNELTLAAAALRDRLLDAAARGER